MKIIPNIEYKSVLEPFKDDIEARNYAFKKLDKQSQRMEIAWEVLQLLRTDTIMSTRVNHSTYWDRNLRRIRNYSNTSKQLQENFLSLKKREKCQVCVRGACMLAQIRLGNSVNPHLYDVPSGTREILKGFTMNTFGKMEDLFERYSDSDKIDQPYKPNTNKMIANIMCNVLVNGDFEKRDKTDYLTTKK